MKLPKGATVIGPNTISGLPQHGGHGELCPPWREQPWDHSAARIAIWFNTWNEAVAFFNALEMADVGERSATKED